MVTYFMNSMIKVWDKTLKQVSFQTVFTDPSAPENQESGLVLGQSGFDFAVGFQDEMTPEIGRFQMYLQTRTPDDRIKDYIDMVKCEPSAWPDRYKNLHLYCPDPANERFK